MIKKEKYEEPAMEVISLASIQETMQSASANGSGSNLNDPTVVGGTWDDLF